MSAEELLAQADALLLDFDGPICAVFAGIPAASVADQLRAVLSDGGHSHLPRVVETARDPFEVFKFASMLGPDEARYVEAAFTALEVEAISTAEPTRGAKEAIDAWVRSGRAVGIVSNNSQAAISAYLDFHDLAGSVACVAARTSPDASLLKPSPHLLYRATLELAVRSHECVFVGDSLTDVEASLEARMPFIGYANKPGKNRLLASLSSAPVVEDLEGLVLNFSVQKRDCP